MECLHGTDAVSLYYVVYVHAYMKSGGQSCRFLQPADALAC
jgi:hypothetical protein